MEKEKKDSVKDFSIEKTNQKRLKGISKFLYVFAEICRVLAIVGIVGLFVAMIIVPVVTNNINVNTSDGVRVLKIFDNDFYYERSDKIIELYEKDKKDESLKITSKSDIEAFSKVLDYLENNNLKKATIYIEIEFVLIVASLFVEVLILKRTHLFFKNIHDENTPFIKENIELLKSICKLLLYSLAISVVINLISSIALDDTLTVEITNILEILVVFVATYIFEYGYNIQKTTKGMIYSEEE